MFTRSIQRQVIVVCMFVFLAGLSSALARAEVNVIPTPKNVEEKGSNVMLYTGGIPAAVIVLPDRATNMERAAAEYISEKLVKEFMLPELAIKKAAELKPADRAGNLILLGALANGSLLSEHSQVLKEKTAWLLSQKSEQAYIIEYLSSVKKPSSGAVVLLTGKGDKGTLYAASTFVQLVRQDKGGCFIPAVSIRDYPDYEYRWGTGPRTSDAGLDWKINLAPYLSVFKAFKPDKANYLDRNSYARTIGCQPVIGLFGDLNYKNRKSYPDGEIYDCIEKSASYKQDGFCMSNEALLKLKAKDLIEYTEKTEPGCLFIHYLDHDTLDRTELAWKNRCASCRERWPNDAIEATDGMVGAYAYELNRMIEAVFSVEKANGYKASRDCLLILSCAPYGRWSEPDAAWKKEIEFYINLSKCMRQVPNVKFILREQGPRQDNSGMRIKEMAEALKTKGKGHGICVYLHLGDTRRTGIRRWPAPHRTLFSWNATPVLSQSFEGAEGSIMIGAANVALISEYMWNRKPVNGYWSVAAKRNEWGANYADMQAGRALPEAVIGQGGFFDRVQRNIYGDEAGKQVADGLRPVIYRGEVIAPVDSWEWLKEIYSAWLVSDERPTQTSWLELFQQLKQANQRAVTGLQAALKATDLKPGRREEVQSLLVGYRRGLFWLEVAEKEVELYLKLWSGEQAENQRKNLADMLAGCLPGEAAFAAEVKGRLEGVDDKIAALREKNDDFQDKLLALKKNAGNIQAAIREELAEDKSLLFYEHRVMILGYTRIAVVGPMPSFLENHRLGYVEPLGNKLTEAIYGYDVLYLNLRKKLSPEELVMIRKFVSSGGGLLISSATPYYITGSGNLTSIADWLGAKSYGNLKGKLISDFSNTLMDGSEKWLAGYECSSGSACLGGFLTGMPLLRFEKMQSLAFMVANKFEKGRVVYLSRPDDIPEEMLLRTLLWLFNNRLKRG
ncbi:MAG: glycoside hydrolase family 20 zincin-like fold domain-containing protein [bacterium]|nr:glycoside hydrolase family 20 zincin-like fold domain-containing protein [bacterium]